MKDVKISDIKSFAQNIGRIAGIDSDKLFNHIISCISAAITVSDNYHNDILCLYNSVFNASNKIPDQFFADIHVIDTCSSVLADSLKQKAKILLICAETDCALRFKLIDILKMQYKNIYKSVKKYESKFINEQYQNVNFFLKADHTLYERSIYIYFCVYCSPIYFDSEFLIRIMDSIINFESHSLMNLDLPNPSEISDDSFKNEESNLYALLGEDCSNPHMLINSDNPDINKIFAHIKNLFYLNKLNPYDFLKFLSSDTINLISLAHIKSKYKIMQKKSDTHLLICEIFIQLLIQSLHYDKTFYFDNSPDKLQAKLYSQNELLKNYMESNRLLKIENDKLKSNIESIAESQNTAINKKINAFNKEIALLQKQIGTLQAELEEEKNYRSELYSLREIVFNNIINENNFTQIIEADKIEKIRNFNILIVGGVKGWRRKLKDKYDNISTLNGNSTNFQCSMFDSFDCVLFFTGHLSHAVYNKIMNYIRSNKICFGYLKVTNVDLLESEIYNELKKCNLL